MLYIGHEKIENKNIQKAYSAFARHEYDVSDKVATYIIGLIKDHRPHYYSSKEHLRREVYSHTRRRSALGHLTIMYLHRDYPRAYTIIMTGRRADDFRAANMEAGLRRTPQSYTWHHAENIRKVGRNYFCRMYLISTKYHRDFPHTGGVAEYERETGRKYL